MSFKSKMCNLLFCLSLAFGFIALALPVKALASPILYNFTSPLGTLGTSQSYTASGVTITAYGFNGVGGTAKLYGKNDGGDEIGLGIAGGSDNEINKVNFVQLDLSNLWANNPTSLAMAFGSVQSGEGWKIYGSNTLGTLSTLLFSGSADYPTAFNFPSIPNSYKYIGIQASGGDVLIASLSGNIVPTPEPATYLLLGSTLLLVGAVTMRRKKVHC